MTKFFTTPIKEKTLRWLTKSGCITSRKKTFNRGYIRFTSTIPEPR